VENNKTNPPENVVTREFFKPSHRICGAIFEISGTIVKALLIPIADAIIPNIEVAEPIKIILSILYGPFIFLNKIKIKEHQER